MKTFFNKYATNFVYSQNGEEGIISECFKRMDIVNPVMCEFGAHNGKYCSNTRYFVDKMNGSCIMIEANHNLYIDLYEGSRGKRITAMNKSVSPANINELLLELLPNDFDLLSIDTDGDNDYDCFAALKFRPKIIIVEINSSFGPEITGRKDCYMEMCALGYLKGYFLLCHTGNLVFVDIKYLELFPEIPEDKDAINFYDLYFNTSWLK